MSAKFLHAFTDENSDLEKQMGCMTGIFQMFDRQQLVSGRRIHGNSQKKLTSGPALSTSATRRLEHGSNSPHTVLENNLSKSADENKRISMESSRISFSSSSCSSFSSQQDSLPYDLTNYQEKTFKTSPKLKTPNVDGRPPRYERDPPNASNQIARRSLDFRDVVKESINRDSKSLLTKSLPTDVQVKNNHVLKYIDSPRPMHLSKSMSESKSRDQLPWNFPEFKESPRTSFEISRQSLDSRDNLKLNSIKLQELPRLSLDSRVEPNLNLISKDLDRKDRNQMIFTDSNQKGSASVVAKLMGLEAMPSLSIVTQVQNSKPSKELREDKDDCYSHSPKKHVSNVRVPIETAPWRKQEKNHVSRKTNFILQEEPVYSEIERRLKELEFRQSNKDLRALKQILDAMQAKGLLETNESDQNQNFNKIRTTGNYDSPIVIMRPKSSVKKSGIKPSSAIPLDRLSMDKKKASSSNQVAKDRSCNSSLKELSDKNKVRSRTMQREASNTSSSLSPRLQKPRKLTDNKNSLESVSPRGKLRQKPTYVQNGTEKLNEEISQRLDSNISLASQVDREVTSAYRSTENSVILQQGSRSPSSKAAKKAASIIKQKKPLVNLREEISNMEFVTSAPEQPSPVSVLDSSFQQDELPLSPLKSTSYRKETDDRNQTPEEQITNINHRKLRHIDNLLQKLTELSPTNKLSPTDHIASLCETQNPDHRYISEILLASGLLFKDLNMGPSPVKLHPSGDPINPDLFLVLEQTKTKSENINKIHRKLLFDAVNQVLIRKLELNIKGRFPSGQKLLKELCVDVEKLQKCDENCNGEIKIMEGWGEFKEELPGLVLEIERSMFKDLIDEVVSGEMRAISILKSSRRRRQFSV